MGSVCVWDGYAFYSGHLLMVLMFLVPWERASGGQDLKSSPENFDVESGMDVESQVRTEIGLHGNLSYG